MKSLPCGPASAYCLLPVTRPRGSSAIGILIEPPHSCKNRLVPPFSAKEFARCSISLTTLLSNRRKLCPYNPRCSEGLRRFSEPTILGACKIANLKQQDL